MLLCIFLNQWIDLYVSPCVRSSTAAMYRRSVEAVPHDLGVLDLEALGAADLLRLRAWQLQRAKDHPRAAQLDRVMLCRSLRKAQALGLMPRALDVAEALPPIRHDPRPAAVLTAEELRRYIDLAPIYGREEAPLLLLCCCGLRRGEALGARWADLSGDVLTISGSRDASGAYGPPKTAHALRAVRLPPVILSVILDTPRSLRSPWIVDTTASRLHKAHQRVLRECLASPRPVTLHGLRHTIATLAAEAGEPMKLLQIALGHSKINLTADLYADHITAPSLCVVRAFESFLSDPPTTGARLEIV